MKILNFGSCNVDFVYSLDHIVRVGETESTKCMEIFAGGKGLNQSIAVARAGGEVYHAGCIGTDGGFLKDLLEQSGVDVSYLQTVDAKNGHAIIQVSAKGENSIFLYPGSNEMVTKELVDAVLQRFEAEDVLLLQNEISHVDYIIRKAHEKQMCIVFNPSPFNEAISKIDFAMLSYLILNEVEAQELSGQETPEEALFYFRTHYPSLRIMLTLGEQGCVYADAERELWQLAYRVKTVDTTAAGDTFTGYFVSGIAQGEDCREILKLASAAAAIAVSRKGAAPSIPTREEVLSRLAELPSGNSKNRKTEQLRHEIEQYLEQHLRQANLQSLAEQLGYSAVYTGALVKQLTGVSFSKLLQAKRCRAAADMLLQTDLPIAEIIHAVGYENESFFRDLFSEKYGKTPIQYRKKR